MQKTIHAASLAAGASGSGMANIPISNIGIQSVMIIKEFEKSVQFYGGIRMDKFEIIANEVTEKQMTETTPDERKKIVSVISSDFKEVLTCRINKMYDYKIRQKCEELKIPLKLLDNIHDAYIIAVETNAESFNKIVDCVLENEKITLEEKIRIYNKLSDQNHKSALGTIKTIGGLILAGILFISQCLIQTNPEYNKTQREKQKQKGKTDRSRIRHR